MQSLKKDHAQQAEKFQSIGNKLETSIEKNSSDFNATNTKTNQVLDSITGGDSYSVVAPVTLFLNYPNGEIPMFVENHGSNILTGVSVTIYQSGVWIAPTHQSILRSVNNRINVGTLHPGERLVIDRQINPENFLFVDSERSDKNFYRVIVYIAAQNFTTAEYLDFRKTAEGKWEFRYKVFRQYPFPYKRNHAKLPKPDKLIEEIDWSSDSNNVQSKR